MTTKTPLSETVTLAGKRYRLTSQDDRIPITDIVTAFDAAFAAVQNAMPQLQKEEKLALLGFNALADNATLARDNQQLRDLIVRLEQTLQTMRAEQQEQLVT